MNLKYKLIQWGTPFVPDRLRALVRRNVSLKEYDYERLRTENPFLGKDAEHFPCSPVTVGIIGELTQSHQHYIAACREMKISYRIFDLAAPDWVNQFSKNDIDVFLVWPSISNTAFKAMFDSRLRILREEMGKCIYPTVKECWLYEHKPRVLDWLNVHNIPHPKSWVFYDEKDALAFANKKELPVVIKTPTGACGSGIQIVKSQRILRKLIRKYFRSGITPTGYSPFDRQWGVVYLQEYLEDVQEWRMVRIGDSFFGYRKERGANGLHSASKKWSWINPDNALLDILKQVTDIGSFMSMDVDIFQTSDGRFLVNELQTVFGCTSPAVQMKVNGLPGRYLWEDGHWKFQEGDFFKNHMCNLRIEHLRDIFLSKQSLNLADHHIA